jgi:uncharacterized integral membrane protein
MKEAPPMNNPTDRDAKAGKGGWFRRMKTILVLIAVVLLLILFFQNRQGATVEVLFWSPQIPVSLLMLGTFVAGAAIGWIALRLWSGRRG